MNFENLQLDFADIPSTKDVELKPIETNYKKVILFSWSMFYLLLIIGAAIIAFNVEKHHQIKFSLIAFGLILFFMLVNFIWINIEFKYRSFAVRQHDILYKSGWLFQKTHAVPFAKIQHCSVVQGFISRKYGLANIKIHTAASNNFDITVRGLMLEQAEQLKDWLMKNNVNND